MATIVLQAAGAVFGTLLGGPVGGVLGRALGALGGAAIDGALLSPKRRSEGARLTASRIQEADEGAGIARVYGTARIAGQVIWTTRFEETKTTERQGGKGAGAGGQSVITYSYFGNVAIGLCEGPIAGVRRIWADGEELDLSGLDVRVHTGAENQMPDPLIEAKQGAGNAPAYRGLAYLVFERLPLEKWGNRIPQISCEVIRPVGMLERTMRAVTVIPGASEHGLDPLTVRERLRRGEDRVLNRNMLFGNSDFAASLDELTGLCPRLERAALVVSWFGDDLRAGSCTVRPGVETRQRDESRGWRVGPVSRDGARLISRSGGGPAYGGTPSDAGVVRAIAEMRRRGLKVTFYPFLLMDVPANNDLPDPYGGERQAAYPWRGRITLDVAPGGAGSSDGTALAAGAVQRFVGTAQRAHFSLRNGIVAYDGPANEWSYRRMVLHQAHLAKLAGGVDAFVIGSEMRGLTRLRDAKGGFPFVAALIGLAADVKTVLPDAKITYAADWSEYFGYQPADGSGDVFFNLDPLWSHPAIAMIGIDNYLPVSDWRDEDWGGGPDGMRSPYDLEALKRGILGGENHDWFYASEADRAARRRTPITDGLGKPWTFRAKDLANWWANPHHERRGGREEALATPWAPRSKPIWFTELGCAAINKGANQPNVFLDPKSGESAVPHFSTGARDDLMQRRFLEAQLSVFDPDADGFSEAANPISPVYGARMVDPGAIHLWTWDARPFPAFPGRSDIWSDGENWTRGHWLTGRLGQAPLDGLIRQLLDDHGFAGVDAAQADAVVAGYVVSNPSSARLQLEELLRLCGLAVHAEAGRLVFRSIGAVGTGRTIDAFAETDEDAPFVELRRAEESETPEEIVVGFMDPSRFYQPAAASALRADRAFPRQDTIELPVAIEEADARGMATNALALAGAGRETARFALAPTALETEPGDVLGIPGLPGRWLAVRVESGAVRRVEARRLPTGAAAAIAEAGGVGIASNRPREASRPFVVFLDLPQGDAPAPENAARIASFVRPALPLAVEVSSGGGPFAPRLVDDNAATIGELVAPLVAGPEGRIDAGAALDVELYRGALFSITRERLLGGGNLCAVLSRNGEWEVLQFERAEETAPMRFRLTRLVRAQGGTDDAMVAGAGVGAPFVLLDAGVEPVGLKPGEIGRVLEWRVAASGRPLHEDTVATTSLALGRRAITPLSPVHACCRFERDGAAALRWLRRTRVGGDDWDGLDVPLGEEIERYQVVVSDGSSQQILAETETSAFHISAADQVRVFGTLPARLRVRIAQFSLRHGAGTERMAVFDRPAA